MKNPTVNNIKYIKCIGVVCCLLCFVGWPANISKLWRQASNGNQRRRRRRRLLLESQTDRSLQQVVIEKKIDKLEPIPAAFSGSVLIDGTFCNAVPTLHQRIRTDLDRQEIRGYYEFYKGEFDKFLNWPPLMSDEFIAFETITNKKHIYFQVHEIEARYMPHMSVFFDNKGFLSYPTYKNYHLWVKPNYTVLEDKTKIIELNERGVHYIAYISVFPGLFQHFLPDHLPMIAYLKSKFIDTSPTNQKVKLLLVDSVDRGASKILHTIDPEFEKNYVLWVTCDRAANCHSITYDINDRTSSLTIMPYVTQIEYARHPEMFRLVRIWLQTNFPYTPVSQEEKTVIYYARNKDTAGHGRALAPALESEIIASIHKHMELYNRKEKFVLYDGTDPQTNETMSILDQIHLFRSATTIIGAHGGGLANVLWSTPGYITGGCNQKNQRPKVLEFLVGVQSRQVQKGPLYGLTWAQLFSLIPWVEYHHILYTSKSTKRETYVNMEDVEDALEAMWGP